ncbi:hypothetical protein [Salinisphaera sp. LB1]|uniref:hypothetical protein n=1 Tax=Salinisphaera sp. LB1 TaxID=2183911 RepID=UPI000D7D5FAE|nr:hypothetical protein [Salinisphaera sp. LB1]AWN17913.1 hypothetical protein SALB1_3721 [Salinisphaera sp. LB1]
MSEDERQPLAERVRDACIAAALAGYEDAAVSGLCGEGALEVAISSIRGLALGCLLDEPKPAAE